MNRGCNLYKLNNVLFLDAVNLDNKSMYHNMLGAGVLFLISSTSMRARDCPARSGCDMFYSFT